MLTRLPYAYWRLRRYACHMTNFDFTPADIAELAQADVARALAEDVGAGDLTASLIDPSRRVRAKVLARESAVICGAPWVTATVKALDASASIVWHVSEGQHCHAEQVILEIEGNAQALLTAERTALNFMQLLSAVASKTASFVEAVNRVAGNRAQIVDTRKTIPGLRLAQKYAVRIGGGSNHRIGLYDAILIKENHIAAAGGVTAALKQVQTLLDSSGQKPKFVEVEVETLAQLKEALAAGARMVLLDNMSLEQLRQAVAINAAAAMPAVLEVSGGVNMDSVQAIAACGVDRISIGALTKDVKATDFSMRFENL
jgi:nicotinate-nucleotide pyrophosphorylase (carboxylating)